MIIDDTASLKEWVVAELAKDNIDADPEAVAKYTVALVRKGADSEEELRPSICENLAVFLTENTESFVMRLFSVLQDKSYLPQDDPTDESITTNTTSDSQVTTDTSVSRQDSAVSRQESKTQDTDDELSDDDRDHRRTARRSRSRSRSRSPSGQQNRQRLSPHRRLGYNRGGPRGGGGGYQPRGMRRGNARSRLGRGGYHNNDYNRRYDNGVPPLMRRRSRSPKRSLSPVPRRRSRSPRRSLSPRRSSPPRSRSPLDLLSSLDVKPSTTKKPDTRQRCRDYDGQGFCLKGDLCPFSHGNDAVVMTDVTGLNLGSSSSTSQPLAPVNPAPPTAPNQHPAPIRPTIPPAGFETSTMSVEPYNPELPRMWGPGMNPAMRQPMPPGGPGFMMPPHPRAPMGNFPNVPPHMPHPGMRHMGPRHMYRPRYPANGQQRPGVSHPPIRDPNRATLEIRNLPVEFNKIVKLHEHFEKFGTIHNLQVQYNGSPTTALVTFSSNAEAKRAHQNPEPLFNNRFIKIFWHNEDSQTSDKDNTQSKPTMASRLGGKNKLDPSKTGSAVPTKKARVEPNMNRATLRLDKSAQARKVPQAKKLDQRKLLDQQRQTILIKLIEQQKRLIATAEKTKDPKLKSEILKELRKQEVSIKEMKESLESSQAITKSKETAAAKAALTAKEILDVEIDVHQKKLAGEDTAELQKKLDSLKQEAYSLGLDVSKGRGGGRGGRGRGRGRGGYQHTQHTPAPPPPTALTILGFTPDEKDAVIAHFKQYGSVTDKEFRESPLTSIVIEYSKAHDAKVASIHGAKFGTKNLIMKWYKPSPTTPPATSTPDEPSTSAPAPATSTSAASPAKSKQPAATTKPVPSSKAKPVRPVIAKQEVTSADTEGDLLDNADKYDDLLSADADGNDESAAIDEDLLLGDEDYGEDDSEKKRVWLP